LMRDQKQRAGQNRFALESDQEKKLVTAKTKLVTNTVIVCVHMIPPFPEKIVLVWPPDNSLNRGPRSQYILLLINPAHPILFLKSGNTIKSVTF